MSEAGPRVAFDIGGTFTDIIVIHPDGRAVATKVLSVTDTLLAAVREIIERVLAECGEPQLNTLAHATTVCSNTLLQRTFAPTGLVTTVGFRDEMELRRESRPLIYDFGWERLPPLVPRRHRVEIVERMSTDGTVQRQLDRSQAIEALAGLRAEGIEALAICLVNSHVNPDHEIAVEALAREQLPGIDICASYEVLPKVGEYERMSTTCVNASLIPEVRSYLDRVEKEVLHLCARLSIMQSNGGLMTLERARREPVRMIESGPAAGVLCAAALAAELGIDRVVSFDMGGTTVKGCLIEGADPVEKIDYEVGGDTNSSSRYDRGSGYAVAVPSFDIVEAGAGGGSIAWVGNGVLHVGPQSAGADPGPACYGNGGTDPTVTDANVALGYINPQGIADLTLAVDSAKATAAIDPIASELGLSTIESAYGIYSVANALMMRTIRAVTTERGRDPREFTMISFGGSGPVHAAALASMLGIETVCVPLFPGLFSALGLLIADVRYDALSNVGSSLEAMDLDAVARGRTSLIEGVEEQVRLEGLDPDGVTFKWFLDMRYRGQGSDIVIDIGDSHEIDHHRIGELFHQAHEGLYGYRQPEEPITVASLRVKAFAPATSLSFASLASSFHNDTARRPHAAGSRPAYFGSHGFLPTRVVDRAALVPASLHGPAIIEEPDTTVVVPPGWTASLDALANIVLTAD